MKIAITSQGETKQSAVDPRFGRAKYFIVIDSETAEFKAIDNLVNLQAAQGAGIQTGRAVAELGVEAVITGNVGPKAFSVLNAAGIKIYLGASGTTVEQALAHFKEGALQVIQSADVEGHWM